MKRRTFIQGAAVSIASLPLIAARGQVVDQGHADAASTIVYTNAEYVNILNYKHFNPLTATAFELCKYEFPLPDPNSPVYSSLWRRLFSNKTIFYRPRTENQLFVEEILVVTPSFTEPRLPSVGTRWETSQNWSGGYIEPHNGNMFVEVAGSWIVPTLPTTGDKGQAASIWVGLDGQRQYINSSLPQIGTTIEFSERGPKHDYRAWYQWWVRGRLSDRPDPIRDIKLAPGDEVFCDVQAVDPTHAIVCMAQFNTSINNAPSNVFWHKMLSAPPSLGRHKGIIPEISGATAEWIVERVTVPKKTILLPLLDYGTVDFKYCWASVAPQPGATPAGYQTLDGAQYIRMYDRPAGPPLTAIISSPNRRRLKDLPDAFTVAYTGR